MIKYNNNIYVSMYGSKYVCKLNEEMCIRDRIIVIVLFTYFIVLNIMGKDYDAAVLVAGTCGFGMGATPNAMANMQAVCDKYVP